MIQNKSEMESAVPGAQRLELQAPWPEDLTKMALE
jgi:hypothetical protein